MRTRRHVAPWIAVALLGSVAIACTTDPKIQGPTRMVVGQRVTVELERGNRFVEGELGITDGTGFTYSATDPLLEYFFDTEQRIQFTVPYGIATGFASVSVGAQGRGPYVFDVEVVRLFGVLSVSGRLTFSDLDAPSRTYGTAQVGTGGGSITLSAEGDRIIGVTSGLGEVHFLELRADGLVPFAPSVSLGFPLAGGALVSTGALVAADRGVGYIERRFDGQLILNRWLDTGPTVAISAAGDQGRAVSVGTTDEGTPTDVLHRINVAVKPPILSPPRYLLGGSAGGVADVVITPLGESAVTVNTIDEQLTVANLLDPSQVLANSPVPAGCVKPTRLAMARRGNFLAVVCPGSKTVAVYAVESGGIGLIGTVDADPRTSDPALAQAPVDAGFAPPRLLLILLADGSVTRVDLQTDPITPVTLRGAEDTGASAILVQP